MRALLPTLLLLANPALAADRVLVVMPFAAHTDRADLAPLGPGLADMLTTDLVGSPELTVVERTRLDAVLGELELQAGAFVDPSTAVAVGAGLGATSVVVGALSSAGDTLRIDARVVDVATAEVVLTAAKEGPVDRFFDLERGLALDVLDALDVDVSAADRARLGEPWAGEGTLAYAARLAAGKAPKQGGGRDPAGPTLRIVKKGLGVPGYVFVDGEGLGRPTKGEGIAVRLAAGRHEVAVGPLEDGRVLRCWGALDVTAPVELFSKDLCDRLTDTAGAYGTVLAGAVARFSDVDAVGAGMTYGVEVDGAQAYASPWASNLAPGRHLVTVTRSWSEKVVEVSSLGNETERTVRHQVSHCHGTLTLAPGADHTVMMSVAGCSGLDP